VGGAREGKKRRNWFINKCPFVTPRGILRNERGPKGLYGGQKWDHRGALDFSRHAGKRWRKRIQGLRKGELKGGDEKKPISLPLIVYESKGEENQTRSSRSETVRGAF